MFNNVVIISIDSLRADCINYNRDIIYGKDRYKSVNTPNLDRIAQTGTSFINAYSTNTYTTSAHASLFTGVYPQLHGIRSFFDFKQKLNPNISTLTEEFNNLNFETYLYTDTKILFSEMKIWRGFKHKSFENMNNLWGLLSSKRNKNRRFIFIHVFDVHKPYLYIMDKSFDHNLNEDYLKAIDNLRSKLNIKSNYDQNKYPFESFNEIYNHPNSKKYGHKNLFLDFYLKGIEKFDSLRLPQIIKTFSDYNITFNNSWFIVTSDHGEGNDSLITTTNFCHSGELNEELLRIPVISNILLHNYNHRISITNLKEIIINVIKNDLTKMKYNKSLFIYSELYQNTKREIKVMQDKPKIINVNNKKKIKHYLVQKAYIFGNLKVIINNLDEIDDDDTFYFKDRNYIEFYMSRKYSDIKLLTSLSKILDQIYLLFNKFLKSINFFA